MHRMFVICRSLLLWTCGVLFFSISSLIILISMVTLPQKVTYHVIRSLFRVQNRIMGIRLTVTGTEHIDSDQCYLIMGNHQSLFDLFVIPAAIPICFVGVEAARHFRYPVFGYLIKKWGNIPIPRSNLKQAIKSLESARKTIENGMSIGILPEGGRSLTGVMKPFKKGPFHLALAAKADILPFGVQGLYDFNRKGSWMLYPGRVGVTIGQPIPYSEFRGMSVDGLRALVRRRIESLRT